MRPRGLVTAMASVREAALPTASIVTSAPPDSKSPVMRQPLARRTARRNSLGLATTSAPSSSAKLRCSGCLAAAIIVAPGATFRKAARAQRPIVPAPITTARFTDAVCCIPSDRSAAFAALAPLADLPFPAASPFSAALDPPAAPTPPAAAFPLAVLATPAPPATAFRAV